MIVVICQILDYSSDGCYNIFIILGWRDKVRKKKLTIDEQIVHLKKNGVEFELITEEEAKFF